MVKDARVGGGGLLVSSRMEGGTRWSNSVTPSGMSRHPRFGGFEPLAQLGGSRRTSSSSSPSALDLGEHSVERCLVRKHARQYRVPVVGLRGEGGERALHRLVQVAANAELVARWPRIALRPGHRVTGGRLRRSGRSSRVLAGTRIHAPCLGRAPRAEIVTTGPVPATLTGAPQRSQVLPAR
jgi:hypothetical protein